MSKKSNKSAGKRSKRSIEDVVLVTGGDRSGAGTIEPHSKVTEASVTKPLEQLKDDWAVINQQVVILLNQTNQTTSKTGFALDEVEFKLGINGKGHIGLLAGIEVGGEASISLKFKRSK